MVWATKPLIPQSSAISVKAGWKETMVVVFMVIRIKMKHPSHGRVSPISDKEEFRRKQILFGNWQRSDLVCH
jgi:hypothetical protein